MSARRAEVVNWADYFQDKDGKGISRVYAMKTRQFEDIREVTKLTKTKSGTGWRAIILTIGGNMVTRAIDPKVAARLQEELGVKVEELEPPLPALPVPKWSKEKLRPATSLCYPVKDRINTVSGISAWEIGSRIGAASYYGTVWEACVADDCQYVLKITLEGEMSMKEIVLEIYISMEVGKRDLSPHVYDAWTCEKGGVMVMDKLVETFSDSFNNAENEAQLISLINEAYDLVKRLHKLGFYHGDVHSNNIMLDTEGRLKLIDFGNSGSVKSDPYKAVDDLSMLRNSMFRLLKFRYYEIPSAPEMGWLKSSAIIDAIEDGLRS